MEYSNLGKYAFDLNDGEGWRTLPIQPTDQKVLEPSDPIVRLNGTKYTPMYWDIQLTFQTVPKNKYEEFAKMWKPGRQKIKVNLNSVVLPLHPATGVVGSGWFETEGNWRQPPVATLGQVRGFIVYDFAITIHGVELDWLNEEPI